MYTIIQGCKNTRVQTFENSYITVPSIHNKVALYLDETVMEAVIYELEEVTNGKQKSIYE